MNMIDRKKLLLVCTGLFLPVLKLESTKSFKVLFSELEKVGISRKAAENVIRVQNSGNKLLPELAGTLLREFFSTSKEDNVIEELKLKLGYFYSGIDNIRDIIAKTEDKEGFFVGEFANFLMYISMYLNFPSASAKLKSASAKLKKTEQNVLGYSKLVVFNSLQKLGFCKKPKGPIDDGSVLIGILTEIEENLLKNCNGKRSLEDIILGVVNRCKLNSIDGFRLFSELYTLIKDIKHELPNEINWTIKVEEEDDDCGELGE